MFRARVARPVATAAGLVVMVLVVAPFTASAASAGDPAATAGVRQQTADEAPADDLTQPTTSDPWSLPDRLVARLGDSWQKNRQVYLDRGSVSIRANAMLLELHSLAALAGHNGASRQDSRIPGLVRLFTTPPVVVTQTSIKRTTANFPHTPAWESVFRADSTRAQLHPSADAIIARALATAWRARDVAGLPLEDSQRIQQIVGAVAHGSWYKAPTRAENQINWNADVYEANLEVNGDRSLLPDYRAHLQWFIDHADRPAYRYGSSNLSRGDGFRYLPKDKGGSANAVDTVEYANLVHSALGFYNTAVQAGMRPLDGKELAGYKAWTRHLLYGTWTHAGYLNWDSGLGTARRHIRQYWGFSLDALVRSSGPGALLGTPDQRSIVRSIAERGLELFRKSAWDGTGPLPKPTSFDAPNGFISGTRSSLITTLRFAVVAASLDVRLPSTTARPMGNAYSHDSEFGRLAVSTPSYNLAVIKPVTAGEGGLEPNRLFDGKQRPLTVLGAGGFGGPAMGLRLQRGGSVVLDDQPGTQKGPRVPGMNVARSRRNNAGTFTQLTSSAVMRSGRASIAVNDRFTSTAIETKYRIQRGAATSVTLRLPVWGADSTIQVLRGATAGDNQYQRTGGALLVRATTPDGASMLVAYRGIPRRAEIVVVGHGRSGRAPDGARELRIRFRAKNGMEVKRRIAVVVNAPDLRVPR